MEKNTRIYSNEQVQIHGGVDGDSFGNWWWIPSHNLPDVEEGKEIVILHPCDCGCWSKKSTERAMNLILASEHPDKFVLFQVDTRYRVFKDGTNWFIVDMASERGSDGKT